MDRPRPVRTRPHVDVRQQWDYDNPCEFCGRVWLKNNSAGTRGLCCMNGKIFSPELERIFPHLERMPMVFESLTEPGTACDFGLASNVYNNMLSLGAVGVGKQAQVMLFSRALPTLSKI